MIDLVISRYAADIYFARKPVRRGLSRAVIPASVNTVSFALSAALFRRIPALRRISCARAAPSVVVLQEIRSIGAHIAILNGTMT
jgi:hypothetical protein